MKTLFTHMQEALDEAVSESDRIGDIVAEIKRCGYDLNLVLDFAVTISPTDDPERHMVPEPRLASMGGLRLNAADWKFLKELNISLN